jgi:hypothetical protein
MPNSVSPSFDGFAIVGSLATLVLNLHQNRRSMTLRRRVFPVLLFLGAILLSRTENMISIKQAF